MIDHPSDLLPGYVLGALDADEAWMVAEHLRFCPACRAEADDFSQTVAELPYSAEGAEPPARVKRQLFARIAAYHEPIAVEARPVQPVIPSPLPRRPRWQTGLAVTASACAAVLALVAYNGQQAANTAQQQLAQSQVAAQSATQREAALGQQLAQSQAAATAAQATAVAAGQQQQALDAALAQSEARVAALQAEREQALAFVSAPQTVSRSLGSSREGLNARMYMQPGHNRVVLQMTGLPPAPAGKVYQFWLASNGQPIPSRTFGAGADGVTELVIDAPAAADTFVQVMVTLEQAGGSSTPSNEVIVEGELRSA